MKYIDKQFCAKFIDLELGKIGETSTMEWLNPASFGIFPTTQEQIITMKLSFAYKRNPDGTIVDRKVKYSERGDKMLRHIRFDPNCTTALMVERSIA